MRPSGCSSAAEALGVEIEAILLTHCHFDHIGAVAPVAARHRRPRLLPADRASRARRRDELGAARVRALRELRGRPHARRRRAPDARRASTSTVHFTPGHSPGHLTYALAGALLSGDVLFQGSVGRVDLPGGDWATLERSIEELIVAHPARHGRLPGPHGRDDARARARDQPVSQRAARSPPARRRHGTDACARTLSDSKLKAPRGTFDVLGERGLRAQRASRPAPARSSRARATSASRRPPSRPPSCSRAASGSPPTSCARRCSRFTDAAGRSLTLRPEGTAPVCRAYVEHGMHKRRQPVKLWYLSSFFRHERAQAGRYRQFWQVGAEALGSEDPAVDAESIVLLATLLAELHVRDVRLRLSSLGSAETPRRVPRAPAGAPARQRGAASPSDVRERIELNPLRAFDSDHPGHARGDGERAAAARSPQRSRTASTSTRCARCSTPRASPTRSTRRSCAAWTTTRAPSSSSPPTRSARRAGSAAAGATTASSSSSAARRHREWAGRRASSGSCSPATRAPRLRRRSSCSSHSQDTGAELRRTAFALLSEARAAGLSAQMDLGGRSLKGQLGHAGALRCPLRRDRRPGRGDAQGHPGWRPAVDRRGRRRARCAARPPQPLSAPRGKAQPSTSNLAVQLLWPRCRSRGRWLRFPAHFRSRSGPLRCSDSCGSSRYTGPPVARARPTRRRSQRPRLQRSTLHPVRAKARAPTTAPPPGLRA